MWQAISHLLSEQLGEGEIELRNELPGGEIHAAWHLRYAGRDLFVKCDERELLPIFTAEADQLELLSRSKTVNVPQVLAVGSDRDYSFLVMNYLPARPLDAHNAFILGQQIARLHQWSDQPQFGLDFDNDLSTTPQPNAWQRRWSTFFAEQRIGWQLELAAVIYGRTTARLGLMVPIYLTRPATGATENVTSRCCRCTLNSRRKFMMAISLSRRYLRVSLNVSRFISCTPC